MKYTITRTLKFNPLECFISANFKHRTVSDVKVNMVKQFIRDMSEEIFGEGVDSDWTITFNGYNQIKFINYKGTDYTEVVKNLLRESEK